MNSKTFFDLVDYRFADCKDTLVAKGNEYSTDDDKLRNFRLAAQLLEKTDITALSGMFVKHVVSIFDMFKDIERTSILPTPAMIKEKFGDAINYLLLAEGIIEDERTALRELDKQRVLKSMAGAELQQGNTTKPI